MARLQINVLNQKAFGCAARKPYDGKYVELYPVVTPVSVQKGTGRFFHAGKLLSVDSLLRKAEIQAMPRFYFYKVEDAVFRGNYVDLVPAPSPVASHDFEAPPRQEFGRDTFSFFSFFNMQCHILMLYFASETGNMENSEKIFKIKGVFKHYDWGGKTFLPSLINVSNEEGKPYAEYWLGGSAHEIYGSVPYLFKVLDVEKMLSIQVHPSKETARRKFAEENARGIPVDAPERNYRDENHKPELLSPLSDFYLLHGFKPPEVLRATLGAIPEFAFLGEGFNAGGYRNMYNRAMTMPQDEVNAALRPVVDRILPMYQEGRLQKSDEHFWAARAALYFNANGHFDRGIFSIYFFNLLQLHAGEALFQDAGMPHAYLEGQTMEIMASSDNVLRGGLTPKHVDIQELLENIRFEATVPRVMGSRPAGTGESIFHAPVTDFQLSRINVRSGEGMAVASEHVDIYFVARGSGLAVADEQEIYLRSGDSMLVRPGMAVHFRAEGSDLVMFRATEP